jgi:hypothetical protein
MIPRNSVTGKSLLEAFILASTNPQYDKRLFNNLPIQYMTGNALEWVQRVHEPADVWDITFCTRRFLLGWPLSFF